MRLRSAGSQITRGEHSAAIDLWAVHPGGRTILDAVEQGLGLRAEALSDSRGILLNYGNMSSATVMFVLQQIMQRARLGTAGLRHVVWPRFDCGDHALPCRLTHPISAIARSSLNSWMSLAAATSCAPVSATWLLINRWTMGYRPQLIGSTHLSRLPSRNRFTFST